MINVRQMNGTGVMLGLGGGVVVAVLVAVALGAVLVPLDQVARMFAHRLAPDLILPTWTASEEQIIFEIRLLRVLGCLVVGMALGVAGVALQGIMRNPMADPYIIGTSGGAGLGATLAMLLPIQLSWFTRFRKFGIRYVPNSTPKTLVATSSRWWASSKITAS